MSPTAQFKGAIFKIIADMLKRDDLSPSDVLDITQAIALIAPQKEVKAQKSKKDANAKCVIVLPEVIKSDN